MVEQRVSIDGFRSGVVAATLTAGVLAAVAVGSAPAASASCASFFGLGNSAQCSSSPTTIAVAIGANAKAHAGGVLSTALAFGDTSVAQTSGWFASALAAGNNSNAKAGALNNFFNVALDIGNSSAGKSAVGAYGGIGNIAVNFFGSNGKITAIGDGNLALSTATLTSTSATGNFSTALNLAGYDNYVHTTGGTANLAFNVGGTGNNVQAGNGPFAVAGALSQISKVISQTGPGVHINGVSVGGASATQPANVAASATKSTQPTAVGRNKPHPTSDRRAGK